MDIIKYIKKLRQKTKTKNTLKKINKDNKKLCNDSQIGYFRMNDGTSGSRIIKLEKVK
jgi:hypothetical protein